jgi:putative colanic acid biosynthesis UDP-glucose lipid carrier transferase
MKLHNITIFSSNSSQVASETASPIRKSNTVAAPSIKGLDKEYSSDMLFINYNQHVSFLEKNVHLENLVDSTSKRIFDIAFSLLVIVFILSWLIPILGILIKLESKGPIFYKQKRSGLRNKTFKVFKFRSMSVNNVSDIKQATKNDPRVTKIGNFIRKTSIDELPQFINVFLGEMSVVGPRPHMLSHTDYFSKKIDNYMSRHFVKPGITGLAQIKGYRGETNTIKDMRDRVRMDIFYIKKWTFKLDVKIIMDTIKLAIFGDCNAY